MWQKVPHWVCHLLDHGGREHHSSCRRAPLSTGLLNCCHLQAPKHHASDPDPDLLQTKQQKVKRHEIDRKQQIKKQWTQKMFLKNMHRILQKKFQIWKRCSRCCSELIPALRGGNANRGSSGGWDRRFFLQRRAGYVYNCPGAAPIIRHKSEN